MIKIKRAYEKPAEADGERYLVDRLWPRGIKKEDIRLTNWLKGLAPSHELRRWFDHNPERWDEFQERYAAELEASGNMILIEGLADRARKDVTVTLVYAGQGSGTQQRAGLKKAHRRTSEERLTTYQRHGMVVRKRHGNYTCIGPALSPDGGRSKRRSIRLTFNSPRKWLKPGRKRWRPRCTPHLRLRA